MDESTPQPADAFEIAPGVWIAPDALDFTFTRSSGPGGQAVNKLATRAQLRVAVADITGLDDPARRRLRRLAGQRLTKDDVLVVQADVHRSQHQNRRECLSRLGELVRRALVKPKVRRRTKPSKAMIERRLDEKRQHSEKKQRRRPVDPD